MQTTWNGACVTLCVCVRCHHRLMDDCLIELVSKKYMYRVIIGGNITNVDRILQAKSHTHYSVTSLLQTSELQKHL